MISTHSSDIMPNWKDMRTKFGYNLLYAIGFGMLEKNLKRDKIIRTLGR
jgi:hypothetical protein